MSARGDRDHDDAADERRRAPEVTVAAPPIELYVGFAHATVVFTDKRT